jgi:Uroporphyrinogen decarboxylase (URO-D)
MPSSSSRKRVADALVHREPDRVPVDFGATPVTGIHVSVVAALRVHFGLDRHPVKVTEPYQMLGEVEEDLKQALGCDVEPVPGRKTIFGFTNEGWKPWRTYQGQEVLVPREFNFTIDAKGDTLVYPEGDMTVPASARMPKDGYFFDTIVRQEPLDEDTLNVEDNLEEFDFITAEDIAYFERECARARATGRFVLANFGGTALGDIALVPAPFLKHPKGIRDIAEWYMSTSSRRDYIHRIFARQVEIAIANLESLAARVSDNVDAVFLCGTDFGTQTGTFCSAATFRDLWLPHYKEMIDWIHGHTPWKVFKHSCGSVERFIPLMIEAGFDILNPVQCSAANMSPEHLKSAYGDKITFWGGGVDTQKTLPFGTPAEVREEVLHRCEVFAPGGGFVFNTIHNVQARTPVQNLVAMFDAVAQFNGSRSATAVV